MGRKVKLISRSLNLIRAKSWTADHKIEQNGDYYHCPKQFYMKKMFHFGFKLTSRWSEFSVVFIWT